MKRPRHRAWSQAWHLHSRRRPDSKSQANSALAIARSKLTSQGQVSVPAEVRRRLGIAAGSVLEWDEDAPEGTGDIINPTFSVLGLSLARQFTDRVRAGFTLNYVNERIIDNTDTAHVTINDQTHAESGTFTFTAEGVNQSHTFTVTDLAGNSNSAT